MRIWIILSLIMAFFVQSCVMVMPLPNDISSKKIAVNHNIKSVHFFDQREKVDSTDIRTPTVSFGKRTIVNYLPFTNSHKDSIQKVLRDHMSNGIDTDVKVFVYEAFKEFSVLPLENKERARAVVRLKLEFTYPNGNKSSTGGADYFVACEDVNDKGFEQLYIITLKNAIHTALDAIED